MLNDGATYTLKLQQFINFYLSIQFKQIYQVSSKEIKLIFFFV